ncbi:MAG: hypothetical protein AB8H12_08115 [Lewinella sp.]
MRKLLICFCYCSLLSFSVACTYDKLTVVESCDTNLVITLTDQTPSACGLASGSISLEVSGAVENEPLSYSLNGTDFQPEASFTSLSAGSYTVTAQQGACVSTLEVTLENAEGLNATATAMPSDCGANSGEITVATSDASGAVSFALNGGAAQSGATFSGLAPGDYEVSATDEIGCQVTLEVKILSTVAFAEVQSIVTASCAISGCHAGNVSPDFRVRENILTRAGRIRARTGNASMPPPSSGGSLTTAQINAIECWVADGAPE